MLKGNITPTIKLTGKLSTGVIELGTLIEKNVTANGTYNASADNADGYSKVVVDVQPDLIEKNVTANGTYNASADNADGYSKVVVDVQPDLIEKNVTANGTYNASADNADGYSKVVVNVQSSGSGEPYTDLNNVTKYFDPSIYNGDQEIVTFFEYSLSGVSWVYQSSSSYQTRCFRCSKPSSVLSGNSCAYINGYTPKMSFWLTSGNDKCIALYGSYLYISDASFNGDTTAFANYMNDKSIIVPRSTPIITTL